MWVFNLSLLVFLLPKILFNIWFFNLLTFSEPNEGYSRNAHCMQTFVTDGRDENNIQIKGPNTMVGLHNVWTNPSQTQQM